jgi:hypothetical protein
VHRVGLLYKYDLLLLSNELQFWSSVTSLREREVVYF